MYCSVPRIVPSPIKGVVCVGSAVIRAFEVRFFFSLRQVLFVQNLVA
jgi:hypothetical protein